ncbi:MAG TPA: hypothetical protein VI685_08555 [Candidatus Angelobacter sp.]
MKRFCLAMTLLGLVLILGGSASSQVPVFDHFLCYHVPNQPVLNIPLRLQDQFDAPAGVFENIAQLQIIRFCNPVTKTVNGRTFPIGNINHHLTMYRLNQQPIIPRQVVISNQFGSNVLLHTADAQVLAAPTGKALPPSPPPPPSSDLDHYKCYAASGPQVNVVAILTDQFITGLRFLVVHPLYFCNPVEKIRNGVITPIRFPGNHLTCYALTSPTVPPRNINILNQFIHPPFLNITVNNPDMLCAPTTKVSWHMMTLPPETSSSAGAEAASAAGNKQ